MSTSPYSCLEVSTDGLRATWLIACNEVYIVREPDHHERLRGALWGMFVGDALAMPVHWYYVVAALQRDFGTLRD